MHQAQHRVPPHLIGIADTLVGAWTTELTASTLALAMGAATTLMFAANVVR